MKKNLSLFGLLVLFLSNTAFAHTGMDQTSILHLAIHLVVPISIYLAIMAAGFYLIKKLPKPKVQRVRIKK